MKFCLILWINSTLKTLKPVFDENCTQVIFNQIKLTIANQILPNTVLVKRSNRFKLIDHPLQVNSMQFMKGCRKCVHKWIFKNSLNNM